MEASTELLEGDRLDGQDLAELGEEVCNVEDGGHMVRLLHRVQWWDWYIKATCGSGAKILALGLLQNMQVSSQV